MKSIINILEVFGAILSAKMTGDYRRQSLWIILVLLVYALIIFEFGSIV